MAMYVELSPPKLLDQSKNVTVRTFHIWPGIVHEHIFLALSGSMSSFVDKSFKKVFMFPQFHYQFYFQSHGESILESKKCKTMDNLVKYT